MGLKICAALIALASPAFALAMPVVAIADYCPTNGNTLARSSMVEAFEHETLPVMGFQFHPERMTDDPKFVELLRVALSPVNGK